MGKCVRGDGYALMSEVMASRLVSGVLASLAPPGNSVESARATVKEAKLDDGSLQFEIWDDEADSWVRLAGAPSKSKFSTASSSSAAHKKHSPADSDRHDGNKSLPFRELARVIGEALQSGELHKTRDDGYTSLDEVLLTERVRPAIELLAPNAAVDLLSGRPMPKIVVAHVQRAISASDGPRLQLWEKSQKECLIKLADGRASPSTAHGATREPPGLSRSADDSRHGTTRYISALPDDVDQESALVQVANALPLTAPRAVREYLVALAQEQEAMRAVAVAG